MKRSLLFPILILTACSPAIVPTSTPTPPMIFECFPHRSVLVWYDTNGDAIPDAGEPLAAGVSVAMYSASQPSQSFIAQTGPDGRAEVYGIGDFGRYCDDLVIEITVPRDYTAPPPGPAYLAGRPQDELVVFPLVQPVSTAAP